MEYSIIYGVVYDGAAFIKLVNRSLANGWKLQGGICFADGTFYQAIYREIQK